MPSDRERPPPRIPVAPERHAWNRYSVSGQWERRPHDTPGGRFGPRRVSDGVGQPGETWTDRAMSGERQPGRYAGRGPKNWRRSDDRIREDVSEALTRDPYVDASEIEVGVQNGEVTLGGYVTDREQKRRAEACVERVDGVVDVHNRLRVVSEVRKPG